MKDVARLVQAKVAVGVGGVECLGHSLRWEGACLVEC